jgi:hypothetical protein
MAGRGRPKVEINEETFQRLRGEKRGYGDIAEDLGVSRKTLYSWRAAQDFQVDNTISDDQLQQVTAKVVAENDSVGVRLLQAYIEGEGLRVTRQRVQECLLEVDPLGAEARRHTKLKRRVYSVPGPHWYWHVDGNHKLIRYGLVIHGGIDGFSRTIVFLRCATNNRARTVCTLFRRAVQEFQWPMHVRGDHGGENVEVGTQMFLHRGIPDPEYVPQPGEHPPIPAFIGGSSKHNQRVERMWRDVTEKVSDTYRTLFAEWEEQGILDPDNLLHLYTLQYLFLPRINESLELFRRAWNLHPLRTVKKTS